MTYLPFIPMVVALIAALHSISSNLDKYGD